MNHFTDLDVAIGEILDLEPNAVGISEIEPDGQVTFRTAKSLPLDPRISLLAGDCIHNTRATLDHLVAQLALLHDPCRTEAITKTVFPITLDDAEFKSLANGKVIPYVSKKAFARIEELQPYSPGNGGCNDPLWILHRLDIIDKHRLHIVAKHKIRPTAFKVDMSNGQSITATSIEGATWKSTEDGAKLLQFRIYKPFPEPVEVQMEVQTTVTVQIENTGLACDGGTLLTVLRDLIEYVTRIANDFGEKFFDE